MKRSRPINTFWFTKDYAIGFFECAVANDVKECSLYITFMYVCFKNVYRCGLRPKTFFHKLLYRLAFKIDVEVEVKDELEPGVVGAVTIS
jgi:hypothetical protein